MTDQLLESAPVPLGEAAPGDDGSIPILIISPGWGSSGYYSPEVLKRAAPSFGAGTSVYRENTQMFWDHPKKSDVYDRPERSIRDLAGILTEAGHYEANGPKGPGIYARMRAFPEFAEALKSLAPHIGLSHYARGPWKEGEAEGRKGPIIEAITDVRSVDFVTLPGRGGAILEAFREAAGEAQIPEQKPEEPMTGEKPLTLESIRTEHPDIVEALRAEFENSATLKEAQEAQKKKLAEAEAALAEAKGEAARLKEAQTLIAARAFVEAKVAGAQIPDLTKARIVEALSRAPVLKDGAIDETAYAAAIEAAVKQEAEYLAKVLGAGKVVSMGGAPAGGATLEEAHKELIDAYVAGGMSKETAERLVQGMV